VPCDHTVQISLRIHRRIVRQTKAFCRRSEVQRALPTLEAVANDLDALLRVTEAHALDI